MSTLRRCKQVLHLTVILQYYLVEDAKASVLFTNLLELDKLMDDLVANLTELMGETLSYGQNLSLEDLSGWTVKVRLKTTFCMVRN